MLQGKQGKMENAYFQQIFKAFYKGVSSQRQASGTSPPMSTLEYTIVLTIIQ